LCEAARAAAKSKRDEEYRRLLYVALTRAEDRLYVAGWRGKRDQAGSWYDLIDAGLQTIGRIEPLPTPPGHEPFPPSLVHDTPQTALPKLDDKPVAEGLSDEALPAFALRPRPDEPSPPRPLVASRPSQPEPAATTPLGPDSDTTRFQRVLDHPEFAALFAAGSRAEVPVVGLIDGRALNGRIDRLVVTDDSVLIVDYKTNRPPPTEAAAVSPAYVEQLAAYRAALERIYPGRRVRTLLLWTDGPRLMEL